MRGPAIRAPETGARTGSRVARIAPPGFWPAAAGGGQESAPAEGRLLCLGAIRGAVAMVAASRRRVSVGSGPEGPRTQSASVVSRQLGTVTRTPSSRASELQHGILPTPMAVLWVRGPAIRAPDDGRTDWFTCGADRATRVLARCRRRRPGKRAGRRPAPLSRGDPRRCGYGRRFAAACLCRKRAGRPAHPERLRRVEAARYCNPHPVVAGIGTAAGHPAHTDGGSLGARAFWPAAAEGGQESAPAEGRLLVSSAAHALR